ncbi:MAG TPA: M6 family metalloprotease domain-containing protein [Gemmatimonadales bacterium]
MVGLCVLASEAVAQGPRGGELGRFEVRGMDFRPEGAWRRKVSRIRESRRQLLRSGNLLSLNRAAESVRGGQPHLLAAGAANAVTGTVFVPVVPIAYSNIPVAFPISDFQQVLFTPTPATLNRPYSLKTYYEELSNGLIQMEGRVFDPVRMDTTNTYFEDGCNGVGVVNSCPNNGTRFGQMLLQALDSVSLRPGLDTTWNQFDNDGPDGLPNSGDDDGIVDFVTFLHPTVDGACGKPGIWSHRFQIRAWNGGSAYVTKTPRRGTNGQPIAGQFIQVDDYTIQSQIGGDNACSEGFIMPIGTVAHETGHAFGLPDLYDTDQGTRTQGIGEWGIMGSGNFTKPLSPATYDAWSLVELGWVTVQELAQNSVVETGPRQLSDTVFLARASIPAEYFLIENRQAVQSDTAQMNPSYSKRKAPGLAIWFIDENVIALGRPSNRVNTGVNQGVSLMQADGLNQLRTLGSTNRGDTGDSYPGSNGNTRFGFATNPSSRNHFNEFAGFAIDRVEQLAGQVMRFRFTRRQPSLFRPGTTGAEIRVAGALTTRYEEVVPQGDVITLGADVTQTVNGGRTEARFLAWSNGGPREQQLVSGAGPDTITATFAASHRVLAAIQGGGTLSSSVQGNLAQGIFVEAGSAVTLNATPPSSSVFGGWQGDTATVNPALVLPMQRPYDVTAVFLLEQQIPVEDATQEVLGTTRLTQAQRDYLDSLGNRNGGYDVGDYLAFLKRAGLQPSAAVLQKLVGGRR